MAPRPAAQFDRKIESTPAYSAWAQQFLLFAIFFAVLMLLHAPLLRLPYFWDEAGYYVPAARDLFLRGMLIPQSTPSNAHPPLVMAWLALAWRVFGYSSLVTRTAMLALSAFSLLGIFRLARVAANLPVAWSTTALVAIYPVYFTESSMAQVDLMAAGFTFWALAAYIEDRPWKEVLWFSLAALAKETAILAPLALFVFELGGYFVRRRWSEFKLQTFLPPAGRRRHALYLFLPVVPLAGWYAYHYAKTGFLLGNPEFYRYNVVETFNPLRIPLAFGMRLWQAFGYFGLYLLTLAGLLAMLRRPQLEKQKGRAGKKADASVARPRIPFWMQAAFLSVLLAYVAFLSAVGGAVLARYMLPVVPLVILILLATLWRRVRYWKLIAGAVGVAFGAGLFINPPYGFSLEDNLAYRRLRCDACGRQPLFANAISWRARADRLAGVGRTYSPVAGLHQRQCQCECRCAFSRRAHRRLFSHTDRRGGEGSGPVRHCAGLFYEIPAAACAARELAGMAARQGKLLRLPSRLAARRHRPTIRRNSRLSQRSRGTVDCRDCDD
jgi:hypothetical protein